ncbi:hypothetical protein Taro_010289 [Colocasia esculenta]|uniref:Bifunctional inhibitor/plant lipid transfer protein/seed storage helical domain-containing protein n=1 Tax=Colocasia esculenta TaxID=4460 RepID=A0A843TYJ1_COLES|nr:hypothetical protein [Colocasia esculenta]
MASAAQASAALFLSLNLIFFAVASGCGSCVPVPKPKHTPPPCAPTTPTPSAGKCPADTIKLGACANVLGGLLNLQLGKPPKTPCCTLLEGLADVEAAVCLCTVLKANILGIQLNLPIHLSLLLNYCGKNVPTGFICP